MKVGSRHLCVIQSFIWHINYQLNSGTDHDYCKSSLFQNDFNFLTDRSVTEQNLQIIKSAKNDKK